MILRNKQSGTTNQPSKKEHWNTLVFVIWPKISGFLKNNVRNYRPQDSGLFRIFFTFSCFSFISHICCTSSHLKITWSALLHINCNFIGRSRPRVIKRFSENAFRWKLIPTLLFKIILDVKECYWVQRFMI